MTTTIEILLRSEFDPSGFNSAKAKAEELIEGIKSTPLLGETFLSVSDDIFPTGEAAKFAEQMEQTAAELKNYATLAAELDPALALKIDKQRKAAEGLAETFKELGALSRTEILTKFAKAGQTIAQQSVALKKASKEYKELGKAAREAGKHANADIHLKTARAIDQEAAALDRLNNELKETAQAQQQLSSFDDQFRDVSGIENFKAKITELRNEAKQLQSDALEQGGIAGLGEALKQSGAVSELNNIEQKLGLVAEETKHAGKEGGIMADIMGSRFNQLGFVMFITENTIKSLIKIVTRLRDAFLGMAAGADSATRFIGALNTGAGDIAAVNAELRNLTRGFGDFNEVQKGVISLSLAVGGSQVDAAAAIAEYARNLDIVTGIPFDETFNTITEAIANADAAALDSIPGLEGINELLQLARLRADRTGESFSKLDESALISSTVLQQMGLVNAQLAQTEVVAESARAKIAELGEAGVNAGIAFGVIKDAALTNFLESANIIIGFQKTTGEAFAGITTVGVRYFAFMSFMFRQMIAPWAAMWQTFMAIATEGIKFIETAFADGLGAAVEGFEDILITRNPIANFVDISKESLKTFADNWVDAEGQVNAALGLIKDGTNETAGALDILANTGADISNGFDFGPVIEQLKFVTGATGQFIRSVDRATDDFNEAMDEIDADFGGKITDITTSLKQLQGVSLDNLGSASTNLNLLADAFDNIAAGKLADAIEEFNDKITDLEDDLATKLGDIQQDLEDKRKDIREDAADKREDSTKKHNKKIEDINEDHQKKIDDINKKFELSRLKALIDRDARALFEAERRRDEDLRKAKDAAEEKKNDAAEKAKDELDKINEQEEKKLAAAEKAADRKERNAQRAAERRRRDLEGQLEEEREQIIEGLEDELETLEKQWETRRAATKKEFEKRLKRMGEDFIDQQTLAKAHGLLQEAILVDNMKRGTTAFNEGFTSWREEFDVFLPDLQEYLDELEDQLNRIPDSINLPPLVPGSPGGGGGNEPPPPPGGGGGSGPCGGSADIGEVNNGQPCAFIPANRTFTAPDCSKWHCENGFWRPGPAPTGPTANSVTEGSSRSAPGTTQVQSTGQLVQSNGTGGQVTINVQGDDTLEEIFKNLAYEAYIEILE